MDHQLLHPLHLFLRIYELILGLMLVNGSKVKFVGEMSFTSFVLDLENTSSSLLDLKPKRKFVYDRIRAIYITYNSSILSVKDDSTLVHPDRWTTHYAIGPKCYIMAAYQFSTIAMTTIPGPEVPPSPDYIPGPEEPQSPPLLDFPLPAAASPTADSLGYVPEYDPEEDDKDPEEDPADYPTDRDDDDDEDEDEDEEEEEEHPAPSDSVLPVHHMTAKISI
ncbi:hypothetical protein Tco_1547577 [Tanacetum coccineum]